MYIYPISKSTFLEVQPVFKFNAPVFIPQIELNVKTSYI